MTKELEALKGIKQAIAEHLHKQTGVSVEKHFEYLQNDTDISIIEQALTPPTANEVIKALSECLAKDVSYGDKQFYYTIENTKCIMFITVTYDDGSWSINECLPPHLITMIGKFYESLEEMK